MMDLDHLAVAGATLAQAQGHVEDALGISLQVGGEHDVFYTHNALIGLEDGLYLEAIAINPDAETPERPRWFDLDRFSGAARLSNWICRTHTLEETMGLMPRGIGAPVALSRADLRWRMVVPEDGILPYDNMCPALIQWDAGVHPAKRLQASGCRLLRLTVSHPDAERLNATLAPLLNDDRIALETGAAGLQADFETPHGRRVL